MRAHSRSIQKTKGDNVNLKAVYKTTVDITSLETTNMNAAINGRQKLQRNQNEEVIASLQSETANVFLLFSTTSVQIVGIFFSPRPLFLH